MIHFAWLLDALKLIRLLVRVEDVEIQIKLRKVRISLIAQLKPLLIHLFACQAKPIIFFMGIFCLSFSVELDFLKEAGALFLFQTLFAQFVKAKLRAFILLLRAGILPTQGLVLLLFFYGLSFA